MRIGILGAGRIGGALGARWAEYGHEVCLGFTRDRRRLDALVAAIGPLARVGSPADVAAFGDIVLLAVPWPAVPEALTAAGNLGGKVLIDGTLPLASDLSALTVGLTTSGAEQVAQRAGGAVVVKAFTSLFADVFAAGRAQIGGTTPTMLLCGDDTGAKARVAQLIGDLRLDPLDCGPLTMARYIEPFGMLVIQLGLAWGYGPFIGFRFLHEAADQQPDASGAGVRTEDAAVER